ncbi:hypothetical protein CTAYLR_009069 [Chrysophaeum taylorii]|uniref:Cation/H+ exchanger transmembrane domain-containing protein n=1 Tax=Chrysophaeum taylorii TaxID=2483200 RepID=A0AAD7XQ86_9STRA|nr:hypothetical protein CTAYLR_009069 [Chrysophaeum taylorii]
MPGFSKVMLMLLRLGGLGPLVGCAVGWISQKLLSHVLNDALNEITITLLAAYGSFGLAEGVIGTSGVLSTVFCGMYLSRFGRGCVSATVEHTMHAFWQQLAHVANTAVFFLAGLIVAVKVLDTRSKELGDDCVKCGHHHDEHEGYYYYSHQSNDEHRMLGSHDANVDTDCHGFRAVDVLYLIELYVALHIIRAAVVGLSAPVLWRGVYGMTVPQAIVIIYGGLRGAVGLALALIIADTDDLPSKLQMRVLFHVSGIAVMTLCINGTTTAALLHFLGLDRKTRAEDAIFERVALDVDFEMDEEIREMSREKYLADADWRMVWRYLPVLSADVYWKRIRDGNVVLADLERVDLDRLTRPSDGDDVGLSRRGHQCQEKDHFFEQTTSSIEAICPGIFARADYPLPPLLRERWVKYHETYGGVLPRFASRPHAGRLSFVEILHAVQETATQKPHHVASTRSSTRAFTAVQSNPQRKPPPSADLVQHLTVSPMFRSLASQRQASSNKLEKANAHNNDDYTKKERSTTRTPQEIELASKSDDARLSSTAPSSTTTTTPAAVLRSYVADEVVPFNHRDSIACDVTSEARARCLWAIRAALQGSFGRGRLSASGLRLLVQNADEQSDNTERSLDGWERLKNADFARPPLLSWKLLMATSQLDRIPLVGRLRDSLHGFIFRHVAFMFEVAYNFVAAYESVRVEDIVKGDAAALRALENEIGVQIEMAEQAITDFVAVFPESANAVKTQLATQYMLVRMQHHFEEAHEHGKISEKEFGEATARVNASRLKLDSHPYTESQPPIESLIASVPFLADLPKSQVRALVRDSTVCRDELLVADTVLAKQGLSRLERRLDSAGRFGWFVIVRGSVEVTWATHVPPADAPPQDHAFDRASMNVDFGEVHHPHRIGKGETVGGSLILTAGSVCCLEEQLLDLPFLATYKTVSLVHAMFFDRKVMHAKARRNDALRRGLWWTVALGALPDYPVYSNLSARDLAAVGRSADFVEGPENPKLLAKLLAQQRANQGSPHYLASQQSLPPEPTPIQPPTTLDRTFSEKRDDDNDGADSSTFVHLEPNHALLLLQGQASVYDKDTPVEQDPEPLRVINAIDLVAIDVQLESRKLRLDACAKAFVLPLDPRTSHFRKSVDAFGTSSSCKQDDDYYDP